jgi:ribosomal protein L40E
MPDAPPVAETVLAAEEAQERPVAESESTGPNWKCSKCGAMVPGDFDVCWKCLTTKVGEQAEDAGELLAEVGESDQETEAAVEDAETLETDDEELAVPTECSRCGSTRIMPGVTIVDQGEGSDGKLKAVIFGSPQALIFKDRQYGEIKADICGKCGHIELRVTNPSELYEHYQKSRGLDRPFDVRQFSFIPCQKCRMMLVKGSGTCPHCGASQIDY